MGTSYVFPLRLADFYTGTSCCCFRCYWFFTVSHLSHSFPRSHSSEGGIWKPCYSHYDIALPQDQRYRQDIRLHGPYRHRDYPYNKDAFDFTPFFFFGLGQASLKTVYSFLGYYNVCHLGGEIKEPEVNIPRSIFISITGIALLYLGMQIAILGVIPWQVAEDSPFIVSLFFERIYGHLAAQIATGLVLFIAVSSLFAVMLGYSRVPYAAAVDGNFFSVFGKLHPTKNFPYVSLLVLASIAFVFSLLFRLGEVITAIVTMRIIIQFVGQGIGLLLYHRKMKAENFPYRMFLYPIPAIVAIVVWAFIFKSAEWQFIFGALGVIAAGCILFLFKSNHNKEWPFEKA
jgi:fructoselysine transporter